MSRTQTIQNILDARRPMAQKAAQADSILDQIEGEIRRFKNFIPQFAANLAAEDSTNLKALDPAIDHLLARLSEEKGKIGLLAQRFSRTTLNIGVVGPARNGKSTLLQQITGLTSEEIPSGNKGHLTGAPSFVYHRDSQNTEGELSFFTESEFLAEVVAPYYRELTWLGNAPSTLNAFKQANLVNDAGNDATKRKIFDKLVETQEALESFRQYLGQGKKIIPKQEIREWIAQEGIAVEGQTPPQLHKWRAVKYANIYCRFSQQDVGSISVSDTPGLGDFISGAEERLAELVGRDLDAALFVRKPDPHGPIVTPPDTNLYTLISKAIPEFTPKDWAYFIVNKTTENAGNLDHFEKDLKDKHIHTRNRHRVNCSDRKETLDALDSILSDIAQNLGTLDHKLFKLRMESVGELKAEIQSLADQAAKALPKAVAAPDFALLQSLFQQVWQNIGVELERIVTEYRDLRDLPHEGFCQERDVILQRLENEPPPGLPKLPQIEEQAAAKGLQIWHGDELHRLRVKLSQAFESLDARLDKDFDKLREKVAEVFKSDKGGSLKLEGQSSNVALTDLSNRWASHARAEAIQHAIELLLNARLPFRCFIQPRIREKLDVFDVKSEAAGPFAFTPGDNAQAVREKLELAWENACYECKNVLHGLEKEPSMALFATVEDFADAILRGGGAEQAKDQWLLFYSEQRNEVWPEDFGQLEADTRLRREWESAVASLKLASASLSQPF